MIHAMIHAYLVLYALAIILMVVGCVVPAVLLAGAAHFLAPVQRTVQAARVAVPVQSARVPKRG